ncbi:AraC family transcriptional regulator [Alicyclobacillus curvatus]|nr:AraC family transcriptional regulator [Alicyclobacillus curvatus]
MEWLERMSEAVAYMEANLTHEVDMAEVARRAYSSSFHFQRMFHMLTDMTVAEYIRKRRLTMAAQELVMTSARVLDISLKYGYDSPESFARAFRKVHGLSPSEARNFGVELKAFPRISFHLSLKGDKDMDYRIVNREMFTVVGKMIRVSYKDGENLRRIPEFWQTCYADGTVDRLRAMRADGVVLGICMNTDHEKEEFTYAIAVESDDVVSDGLTKDTIPASTWAAFPSTGGLPEALQGVWSRIFEEWLPATSYQHSGGAELEVLPPGDDCAADYRSEVWIPVVKK